MGPAPLSLVAGVLVSGATPILVRFAETAPTATGFWRMALALPRCSPASPSASGGRRQGENRLG